MPELPNLEAAIAQLSEFFGFKAHYEFTHAGEQYRITYRQFLPAEIERKLEEVETYIEGCDKAEVTLPNGKKITGPSPAIPLRRDGKILDDGKDARFLIAMWGEDQYRKFEKAGGAPGILTAVWAMMDAKHEEWRKAGSKSAASDSRLAD
jgi:hypothetical protein